MPGLAEANELNANRSLPTRILFWTGRNRHALPVRLHPHLPAKTRHAHHTHAADGATGNFCLIAGIDPPRRCRTGISRVYADAFEWVELPQMFPAWCFYADWRQAGDQASNAASGNYINKCPIIAGKCRYKVSQKDRGDGARPFNPLYWHFMDANRARAGKQPPHRPVFSPPGTGLGEAKSKANIWRSAEIIPSTAWCPHARDGRATDREKSRPC